MVCSAAGRLFWVGPATLYALQQRFPSPVLGKESDLRRRSGRPATPDGEPALPEWETCDTVGITAAISVAGHGVQCGRSAFLGGTCDTICFTAAISVAGPRQTIGPATPEWQTCDARWGDQRHQSGRLATKSVFPSPAAPRFRPASRLLRSLGPSSPPGSASETVRNTLNILALVFWWQSIYICDI